MIVVDKEKAQKCSAFLRDGFMMYIERELRRTRRVPSQNSFAAWMGVPPTSLSTWMSGQRLPLGNNVDSIAGKLGPEIYNILDVPPRIPKDKQLLKIATNWHKLTDNQQAQLCEWVENLTFENESKKKKDDQGLETQPI